MTSRELTFYVPPSADEWQQAKDIARAIATSELVPAKMRRPEAVLACILTGRELGIGPMQALRHIHLVEGKAGMSAELMSALVRRAGHKLRITERTATAVTVVGTRADDPDAPLEVRFSIDDARRAGLAGKDVWKRYPEAMLTARAISACCRALFGDVLAGVSYTPEELDADGASTTTVTAGPVGASDSDGDLVVDPETGEVLGDRRHPPSAEQWRAEQDQAASARRGGTSQGAGALDAAWTAAGLTPAQALKVLQSSNRFKQVRTVRAMRALRGGDLAAAVAVITSSAPYKVATASKEAPSEQRSQHDLASGPVAAATSERRGAPARATTDDEEQDDDEQDGALFDPGLSDEEQEEQEGPSKWAR